MHPGDHNHSYWLSVAVSATVANLLWHCPFEPYSEGMYMAARYSPGMAGLFCTQNFKMPAALGTHGYTRFRSGQHPRPAWAAAVIRVRLSILISGRGGCAVAGSLARVDAKHPAVARVEFDHVQLPGRVLAKG